MNIEHFKVSNFVLTTDINGESENDYFLFRFNIQSQISC